MRVFAPLNTSIPDLGQQSTMFLSLLNEEMMNRHESDALKSDVVFVGFCANLYPFDGPLQGPCSWFGSHQVPQASPFHRPRRVEENQELQISMELFRNTYRKSKGEPNIQLLDLSVKRSLDITQPSSQVCIDIYIYGGMDISVF